MPSLDTDLHLQMLREFRAESIPVWMAVQRGFASRRQLEQAIKAKKISFTPTEKGIRLVKISDLERLFGKPRGEMYGMHWGDPDFVPPLAFIKRAYVMPFVKPENVGLEIGPGGGRWTQYLTAMKQLYVVDYHQEMLEEVKRWIKAPNLTLIKNNGSDFPGIPDNVIDFLFSFDVFVHLDQDIIALYLENMKRVLKRDAVVLLHYSDKNKIIAQRNKSFAEMTPEAMRRLVSGAGYDIFQEDTTTMWHSSLMLFRQRN